MKGIIPILSLILVFSVKCYGQNNPQLKSASISDCQEQCAIDADLTSIILKEGILNIEAGVNLNCGGQFFATFKFWDSDTLDLVVYRKPSKNGTVAHRSCNCYYELSYQIGNVNQIPKLVLINGGTFKENRRDAGWVRWDDDDSKKNK